MNYATYSDDEFKKAVKEEISYRGVLKRLNLNPNGGGSSKHIKEKIQKLGLNIDHFKGKGYLAGRKHDYTQCKFTMNELLVENCQHPRGTVKYRLMKANLLPNKCAICELDPTWQERPLSLVLDHINGINNDNRIENLRLLCPNCNSQTETFTSRNLLSKYKDRINPKYVCLCGNKKARRAKMCFKCAVKERIYPLGK